MITAEKIEKANTMMAEMVKETVGAQGRKELKEWMDRPVVIEGDVLRIRTTLGAWLQLIVAASEAGWQQKEPAAGLMTIGADDAKALAGALCNVRLNGPNLTRLVAAVVVAGRAGEIRVVEELLSS